MPYKDPEKRRESSRRRTATYRVRHPRRIIDQNVRSQNTSRFARAIALAKQRNYEWTIEKSTYAVLIAQPCYYHGGDLSDTGIGLDRLDNTRGYHVNNVVPCCGICNFVRGNRFTPEEMRALGSVVAEILRKRGVSCLRAALRPALRVVGGTDVR